MDFNSLLSFKFVCARTLDGAGELSEGTCIELFFFPHLSVHCFPPQFKKTCAYSRWGGDVEGRNLDGWTSLHYAAQNGDEVCVVCRR